MKKIEQVTYERVEEAWRAADAAGGRNTLGLLQFGRAPYVSAWWLVQLEENDLSRLQAIHSNKGEGQTNPWEELSGGSYSFAGIAAACLQDIAREPHIQEQVDRILALAATGDLHTIGFPVGLTKSIAGPHERAIFLDGCNRLAALHVRRHLSDAAQLPQCFIGEGAAAELFAHWAAGRI